MIVVDDDGAVLIPAGSSKTSPPRLSRSGSRSGSWTRSERERNCPACTRPTKRTSSGIRIGRPAARVGGSWDKRASSQGGFDQRRRSSVRDTGGGALPERPFDPEKPWFAFLEERSDHPKMSRPFSASIVARPPWVMTENGSSISAPFGATTASTCSTVRGPTVTLFTQIRTRDAHDPSAMQTVIAPSPVACPRFKARRPDRQAGSSRRPLCRRSLSAATDSRLRLRQRGRDR